MKRKDEGKNFNGKISNWKISRSPNEDDESSGMMIEWEDDYNDGYAQVWVI